MGAHPRLWKLRDRFESSFGQGGIPISTFRATQAAGVEIIDLTTVIPGLAELVGSLLPGHSDQAATALRLGRR